MTSRQGEELVDGYLVVQSPGHQETWVTARDILETGRKKKYWILATFLAPIAVAIYLCFALERVYEAQALLAPISENGGALGNVPSQFGGLAALAGIDLSGGGQDQRAEAVALFRSRKLSYAFVEENNLLPVLFNEVYDEASSTWLVDVPREVPTLGDAHEKLHTEVISLSEDLRTGLITVSVRWKDAETAATWAEELVRRVNETLRQEAIEQAQQSIAYLEKLIDEISYVTVRQSLFELMTQQIRSMMVANAREQYAFKVIDPPQVADDDSFVSPNRPLLLVSGIIAGITLAASLAFMLTLARKLASGA